MNRWNQRGARLALLALLLLTLPLELTFTKLVELPPFAEESHQLLRLNEYIMQDITVVFVNQVAELLEESWVMSFVLRRHARISISARSIKSPAFSNSAGIG